MKVTIFGAGYVGLVQAAAFAEVGHDVVCVDLDAQKIEGLKAGIVPIFEPDLESMVRRGLTAGKLAFTSDAASGVAHAAVLFTAVGTPPREDGSADVSHVAAVTKTIAASMDEPKILVTKSTAPVGTGDMVRETLTAALKAPGRDDLSAEIVSNPEFLKEGSAVADCMRPDRILIGTSSAAAEQVMRELYAPFMPAAADKIIVMDVRSAELAKYAANAMLATRISFMNEMANIAEQVGADIEWVRRGIGADPRIGDRFLYPGAGYGGSCFPKDVRALIHMATDAGVAPMILSAVEQRNAAQKHVLVDKVLGYFGGDIRGRRIALWGLAFKPNTNDMREAPSRAIIEGLWAVGASVRAFDPAAMDECRRLYGERADLDLVDSAEAALEGADVLIIATEWKVFQSVPLETIRAGLKQPVVFDGRNIIDPDAAARAGLSYFGIGRGEGMKIRVAVGQFHDLTDERLRFATQIGATGLQMNNPSLPGDVRWEEADVRALVEKVESYGLKFEAIENVPVHFYDKVMTGAPGRDEQIENYIATMRAVARAGVPVLGYHFMPNSVWTTRRDATTRGGATARQFDMAAVDALAGDIEAQKAFIPTDLGRQTAMPMFGKDGPFISEEMMWANYSYFIKAVLPVAEEEGLRLALHPDDPPVPMLGGVARLFYRPWGFKHAYELAGGSKAWSLDLCLGCCSEMPGGKANVREMIEYFAPKGAISYIHFRDVQGTVPNFTECFIGDGNYDPAEVIVMLAQNGFDGFLLDDHVPKMDGDSDWNHRGRAHAIGYMQGLIRMGQYLLKS